MKAMRIIAIIAGAVVIMGTAAVPGTTTSVSSMDVSTVTGENFNGLYQMNGSAWFVMDGIITTFTGFATADDGTIYYVKDGIVDLTFSGIIRGEVDGIEADWYVQYGIVNLSADGIYDGMVIKDGRLDSVTGFVSDESGYAWYVEDGYIQTAFSGFVRDGGVYKYVNGGLWVSTTTGVVTTTLEGEIGGWYIKDGIYDASYTGIASAEREWVYVENGKLSSYTGIAAGDVGGVSADWYVQNGIVETGYSGNVEIDGENYIVTNGQATKYVAEEVETTTLSSGRAGGSSGSSGSSNSSSSKGTGSSSSNNSSTNSSASYTSSNSEINEIFKLVNSERAAQGLSALSLNEKLCTAASTRAKECITLFAHKRPDGREIWTAFSEVGYSYKYAGENIAEGYKDATSVMAGWMNSTGHRENILDSKYKDIGIGIATASDGTKYYVQLFGTQN